ncbi:hypothetical protein ACKKBG_A06675 [Auxenochlorella protothecoides x Auxenochlorella symbiontica]
MMQRLPQTMPLQSGSVTAFSVVQKSRGLNRTLHGPRWGTARLVPAARKKGVREADLYLAVPTEPPASVPWHQSVPTPVKVPVTILASLLALRFIARSLRRRGSSTVLEERGWKRKEKAADDSHYKKMMKGVKTVQYEALTPEQIAEARSRRKQDLGRDSAPLGMDAIHIPDNHPFAIRAPVSAEEEALIEERLSGPKQRRRISAADLELMKKLQAEAAAADAAADARAASRNEGGY